MSAAAPDSARLTTWRALRAEWEKFRTLPSGPITVVSAFVIVTGSAALLLSARAGHGVDVASTELLTGVSAAQFLLSVLAAMTACSEWASGTSKVTFLAVPTRWPVLVGKTAVVGAAALLVGTTGAAGSLSLGAAAGIDVTADPALTTRLVTGAGLYLGAVAVFALGIAIIVRDVAGSVLTVLGFLWIAPFVVAVVPVPELQRLAQYLPTSAGLLVIAPENSADGLTPWAGYGVLLAWTAAAVIAAAVTLRTRDV